MKIKSSLKIFWLGMFKNGCGQSGLWNLKLIVSEEWTHGINNFFACWFWYKFIQIKSCLKIFRVGMVKNGCGQSGDGTVKLTVSKEWTDGINHFIYWYWFRKIKSWSKFLVVNGQKWVWPVWSWDSKFYCISKMNRWNKLIFWLLLQIQES